MLPRETFDVVMGTRPEIIKMASVVHALGTRARVVWTGQHYDADLTDTFFRTLGLPQPALRLDSVGGVSRPQQMARIIDQLSGWYEKEAPAAVLVQGDTNTVSAAAQAAHYTGVPVVHVEAGLRSRDRAMPEEINRIVAGAVTDLHCAPTSQAVENLLAEGVEPERIRLTGNTGVDANMRFMPDGLRRAAILLERALVPGGFILATFHRPENVDRPEVLATILRDLIRLPLPVVLPLHPRTKDRVEAFGLGGLLARVGHTSPLSHPHYLALAREARMLISDSGGLQEDCTVFKKPLLVVRESTERPESVSAGFARLVPGRHGFYSMAQQMLDDRDLPARLAATPSPYGDGRAGEHIARAVCEFVDAGACPVPPQLETTVPASLEGRPVH